MRWFKPILDSFPMGKTSKDFPNVKIKLRAETHEATGG